MRSKLPNLSTELYERLFEALQSCKEFDNIVLFQEFIKNGELEAYHQQFLTCECKTKEELIKYTIKYLLRQRLKGIKPALPQFLLMLCSSLVEGDALRDELEDLSNEINLELLSFYNTPLSKTITTTQPNILHTQQSSLLNSIDLVEGIFLEPSDREWIIRFVDIVIEHMQPPGRKNLLLACIPPIPAINSIEFDKGSRVVAEAMVNLIEARDKPNANIHHLEAFLRHLTVIDERKGDEVEIKIDALLMKYRNQVSNKEALSHFPNYTSQQNENQVIYQRLQEVRETFTTNHPKSIYKMDISAIIRCNLDKQRMQFINGFNGHYKGFFTFAVTSINYDILKNYVIESLIYELKQRTRRSTDVRHVHLYPEHFNSLNIEQDICNLQKELEGYFRIQTFNDLIEDNQDTDLVIVLWHMNISSGNFKHVARGFSEGLKKYIHTGLQNRCLIILWANYGPGPLEPLDGSITLPSFEQFEVEHVIEWVETELSNLQKSKKIPEQVIQYCRDRLVAKVTYHRGSLPGTYESLLEPLELGGLFW